MDDCSPPVAWVMPQEGEEGRRQGQGREGLLAQCSAHRCSSRLSVYEPATWQSPCGQRPVPPTPEHSKMIMLKFTLQQASIQGHDSRMMKENIHTHTHTITQTHTHTRPRILFITIINVIRIMFSFVFYHYHHLHQFLSTSQTSYN